MSTYFVDVKVADDIIKTGIQIVEEVDHLERKINIYTKNIDFSTKVEVISKLALTQIFNLFPANI